MFGNLKHSLLIALIVVVLVGFITFGYMTYGLYQDGTAQTGSAMISNYQMYYYVQLILYLTAFGISAVLVWKK